MSSKVSLPEPRVEKKEFPRGELFSNLREGYEICISNGSASFAADGVCENQILLICISSVSKESITLEIFNPYGHTMIRTVNEGQKEKFGEEFQFEFRAKKRWTDINFEMTIWHTRDCKYDFRIKK